MRPAAGRSTSQKGCTSRHHSISTAPTLLRDGARTAGGTAGSPWHRASAFGRLAMVNLVGGDVAAASVDLGDAVAPRAKEAHHWSELAFCGALATAVSRGRADPAVEMIRGRSPSDAAPLRIPPGGHDPALRALAFARACGAWRRLRRGAGPGCAAGDRLRADQRVLSGDRIGDGYASPTPTPAAAPPRPSSLDTLRAVHLLLQSATATKDASNGARARRPRSGGSSRQHLDQPRLRRTCCPRALAEAGALVDDRPRPLDGSSSHRAPSRRSRVGCVAG